MLKNLSRCLNSEIKTCVIFPRACLYGGRPSALTGMARDDFFLCLCGEKNHPSHPPLPGWSWSCDNFGAKCQDSHANNEE